MHFTFENSLRSTFLYFSHTRYIFIHFFLALRVRLSHSFCPSFHMCANENVSVCVLYHSRAPLDFEVKFVISIISRMFLVDRKKRNDVDCHGAYNMARGKVPIEINRQQESVKREVTH